MDLYSTRSTVPLDCKAIVLALSSFRHLALTLQPLFRGFQFQSISCFSLSSLKDLFVEILHCFLRVSHSSRTKMGREEGLEAGLVSGGTTAREDRSETEE